MTYIFFSADKMSLLVSTGLVLLVHAHGLPSHEYSLHLPISPHQWAPKFNSGGLSCSGNLARVLSNRPEVTRRSRMFDASIPVGLRGGCDSVNAADPPKTTAADQFEKLLCTSRSSIVKAFNAMDKDESGVITQAELGEALQTLGVNATEAEVESIFHALDENSDGTINFEVATRARTPC